MFYISFTFLPSFRPTVGWDAMLTDDGPVFFEGNVAAFRAPRRFFLSAPLLRAFMGECRGEGAPVAL